MAAYGEAKARVFGKHAIVVLNRDDAAVMRLVPAPESVAGKKGRPARMVPRRVVSFGATRAGATGRLRPRDRERHGLAGARAAPTTPRRAT